jgi:hypothetical protein
MKATTGSDATKKKSNAGAPTKYKPEYNEQVYKLCLLGATDKETADIFGICEATLNNWKEDYPGFLESIKRGKTDADANVAKSLYKRATGYTVDTVKVFQFQGEPVIVPVVEEIAPDTGAAMAWLKNRRKEQWRDRQDIEHTGKDGGPIQYEELTPEERQKRITELLGK